MKIAAIGALGAVAVVAGRRAALVAEMRAQLERSPYGAANGIDNTPPPEISGNLDRLAPVALDLLSTIHARWPDAEVSSGYRNDTINAAVGGVRSSLHRKGLAFDIAGPGWTLATSVAASDLLIGAHPGCPWSLLYPETDHLHIECRELVA